jgi:serine O-acetyltransferase
MTEQPTTNVGGRIAFPQELDQVVDALRARRADWRAAHQRHAEHGVHFPARRSLQRILNELGAALFPLRLGPPELTAGNENAFVAATLESILSQLGAQIRIEFELAGSESAGHPIATAVQEVIERFAASLSAIRSLLDSDVEAGYRADPAARSVDEVLLTYPSLTAVIYHRIAHRLHRLGAPIVARIIGEIAHDRTGIDIHPGATIGHSFFIDHGTGVVIGETAIIGNNVRLYQGVTLGGDPRFAQDGAPRGEPRHPIIEDDVVVFAGTIIIGRVRIGARSRIEGNLWLREDVPSDSLVEAPRPVIRPLDAS